MPRPDRQRIENRRAPEAVSNPQATRVVASPVDMTVAPAVDHELAGLVSGLSEFHPKLAEYAVVKDRNDFIDGVDARGAGQAQPETAGQSFERGYMHMDGTVRGQQDRSRLQSLYDNGFDKNKSPEELEQFLMENAGALTKGLDPKSPFYDGYTRSLAPQLAEIRKSHLDHQRKEATQRVESNGMALLEQGIRDYVKEGKPVPNTYIDQARQYLGGKFGVTNSRFNDLLFATIKRLGDEGNFAVYDMLKQDRPDGTKGMYYIPEWKLKIDAAQIHSQATYLAKHDKATKAAKEEREERQDIALMDVFTMAYSGDAAGARAKFAALQSSGLFTRASEFLKWNTLLVTSEKKEARADQQETETTVLTAIHEGRATIRDVLNADLTPAQKRGLISQLGTIQSQRNQAASAARAAEGSMRAGRAAELALARQPYETPAYTQAKSAIAGLLSSTPSMTDVNGLGSQFDRMQRTTALQEFAQRFPAVQNDPAAAHALQEEIVKRYRARMDAKDARNKANPGASGMIRYNSYAEADAAHTRGEMNDATLKTHYEFFKAQRSTPQPQR